MKYLLIALLVVACGKHEMPDALPMTGTNQETAVVPEKNLTPALVSSTVFPYEEVKADMVLGSSEKVGVDRYFRLSTKNESTLLSRDLMVKRPELLKEDSFYPEYTRLRVMSDVAALPVFSTSAVNVNLEIKTSDFTSKTLYLIGNGEKTVIGELKPIMNFVLEKPNLDALLKGKKFLAVLNIHKKAKDYFSTLEVELKSKTYRVYVDGGDGSTLKHFPKTRGLDNVLKELGIQSYKNVAEENLLTNGIKSENAEWWLRQLENGDLVFVKDSARAMNEHLLSFYASSSHQIKRISGNKTDRGAFITFPPSSKILLSMQGMMEWADYKPENEIRNMGLGACWLTKKVVSQVLARPVSENEFYTQVTINDQSITKLGSNVKVQKVYQGNLSFWEIEITGMQGAVEISILNIPSSQYVQEGELTNNCNDELLQKPSPPNFGSQEKSMVFNIEALVEKN